MYFCDWAASSEWRPWPRHSLKMSLTDVMDDVDYGSQNFNENEALTQHPLWMTESHFVYHLDRSADGHLAFQRDCEGEPLCSPR